MKPESGDCSSVGRLRLWIIGVCASSCESDLERFNFGLNALSAPNGRGAFSSPNPLKEGPMGENSPGPSVPLGVSIMPKLP